ATNMNKSMAKFFLIPYTVLAVALGVTLAPAMVGGQEGAAMPPAKVERKNRAPVARDILAVKLPKPVEAKLKNGLTVLIVEDRRAPFVSVQLHVGGAGGLFEPPAMTGLASVTAQMLREGTKTKNSIELAEYIDRLGASIGASTSFGSSDTVLSAAGLSDNIDSWLGVAFEVLLQPSFAADELGKLKQRMRVQLREQRSNANFLLGERFNRAVYGEHPAANVSVTAESLDRITQDALRQWHRERYAPQNSILGIAGDIRARDVIVKLEKLLAGWKKSELRPIWPRDPQAASTRKVYLVDRPSSVQTTVSMGNIAIDRRSPDYLPMVVMNDIIGGGASARLFLNLREEKGYTYGVYSDFTAVHYPGPWRAGGNMRTEVTEGAMIEFFNEIRRIRDEKVPPGELAESQRSIVASFALSLEQPSRALAFAITLKLYGLPADYWDTYAAKIAAVTATDVQRVARKYLDPDTLQIAAVGDAGKIKAVLEKYGAVEVYDSNGAPLPPGKS
ncbi:MAG TPA: pitrilysin family protein, partial [Candidatus Limnocylindria bacterium]|nr:pitrilysin family protein [Candidatus Limnocylindria bacterium]